MFKKFIDSNFIKDEYVDPNDKYIVFVLSNTYSLFNAIYYAIKLPEYKCVLIWDKSNIVDFDFDFAKKYFYKYFFIKGVRDKSIFSRWALKVNYIGYFHKFSKPFIFLNKLSNFKIVIFNDRDCITQVILNDFGKNNRVYMCEEGAGIYSLDNNENNFSLKRLLSKILIGVSYKNTYLGSSKTIDYLLAKEPERIPSIKVENRKLIKANNPFIDIGFLELMTQSLNINDIVKIDNIYKYILYLGSPISELGYSENKEIDFINIILNYLSDDEKLLIKLHPRENRNKYKGLTNNNKVDFLNLKALNWIPIELIAHLINPQCVISVLSAAVYNLYSNGLSSRFIYLCKLWNIDSGFIETFINNKQYMNTNIYILNDINEFKDIKMKEIIPNESITKYNEDYDLYLLSE